MYYAHRIKRVNANGMEGMALMDCSNVEYGLCLHFHVFCFDFLALSQFKF